MEATVATQAPPEAEPSHDGTSEATRSTQELFEWSGYVHIGAGAPECSHRLTGDCDIPEHFHAWVCLPNAFQVRDIVDKARAARARKLRALRDPESDSHVVLEAELEELTDEDYERLIDSLARAEIDKRLEELVRSVESDERFEHHAQDAEEYQRQLQLSEDERDAEEFERLQADMTAYGDMMRELVEGKVEEEAVKLRGAAREEIIAKERDARIKNIGTEAYLHTYYTWAIYVGAREPTTEGFPTKRKFAQPDDLRNAPPEAIDALRAKLRALENRTSERGDAAGN